MALMRILRSPARNKVRPEEPKKKRTDAMAIAFDPEDSLFGARPVTPDTVASSIVTSSIVMPPSTTIRTASFVCPQVPIIDVDKRDLGTPDEWIARNPELVRLTGRHPFNAEPTLSKLETSGFITPTSVHYVRNHGAVPELKWNTHKLDVFGLVSKPITLTMDEIVSMSASSFSMLMVCSGNRRKEHNMIKNTAGFHYGAGAACNSVWKGVPLRDLLLACGVNTTDAKYVIFEGSDSLPKCGGGGYATSIPICTALDPACDVIVAYEQNGERLTPDHGFPLRAIVPGHTAGRCVKFLSKIIVSATESDNYYHFYDNRVLPGFLEHEEAEAGGWYRKPEYVINELNVQSVMTSPAHGEVCLLFEPEKTFKVKGFAYSGGDMVNCVEVSIDGGKAWSVAPITRAEEPNAHGKCWSWVWFEIDLPASRLWENSNNSDCFLCCRAWDVRNQRQPENTSWNIMGMMNNAQFRIKYQLVADPATGLPAVRFIHPTLPGPGNLGGWMEENA